MKHWLLLCMILSWTTAAAAQDKIVVLPKGTPAPFDGQLFSNATALRWGTWIKNYKEREEADVAKLQGTCTADLEYKDDLLRIEQDKNHTIIADLRTKLLATDTMRVKLQDEVNNPPWYKTFWFGFGVGAISASVLIVVANQAF